MTHGTIIRFVHGDGLTSIIIIIIIIIIIMRGVLIIKPTTCTNFSDLFLE